MSRYTYERQLPFRMSREQMELLDQASKKYRQSKQAFIQTVVFDKVNEIIEGRSKKEEQKQAAPIQAPTSLLDAVNAIINQPSVEQETAPAPTIPTIVQHFGPSGGAPTGPGSNAIGSEMIDFFASYVVGGDDFEQSRRIRECVKMFKENASTAEETNTLVARLEEAVALKKNLKQSNVVRAAKMAFNKFAHFLSEKT